MTAWTSCFKSERFVRLFQVIFLSVFEDSVEIKQAIQWDKKKKSA